MNFTEEQIRRYSRHIILREVGGKGQQKFLDAKVFLIGAGGLGSPVGYYLAAAGVGTIGIVDNDTVELSNLQRQILHSNSDIGKPKVESAKETMTKMNPDVTVRVVWTKTWYDPATEKEAAKSLLDVGADVIAQHQDSPGPQEAAQEKGVYSIGYNSDMSAFAPKAHLTAPIWNWGPFYVETVKQVKAGTWKAESSWPGLADGIVDLSPMSDMVPIAVQEKVMLKKDAIIGGEKIFAGPLKDQKGVVKVAAGSALSDGDMLGMTWFVQGVVGTTE